MSLICVFYLTVILGTIRNIGESIGYLDTKKHILFILINHLNFKMYKYTIYIFIYVFSSLNFLQRKLKECIIKS